MYIIQNFKNIKRNTFLVEKNETEARRQQTGVPGIFALFSGNQAFVCSLRGKGPQNVGVGRSMALPGPKHDCEDPSSSRGPTAEAPNM